MRTLILLVLLYSGLSIAQPNHKLWDEVLDSYVSDSGQVNYTELKMHPESLIRYLNNLAQNQPRGNWTQAKLISYWINAYNAYTLKLIIDHYPLNSIQDIKDPWNQKFIPYNSKLISLNHIEHKILRKMNEPRIHFAIVCASISCPNLSKTAFKAQQINQQLNTVTKAFLDDETKNKFDEDKAQVSKIFKWFAKDFKASGGVITFIKSHKDIHAINKSQLSYMTYNWGLND